MKKKIKLICVLIIICLVLPGIVFAREGDSGYEGGISSGEGPGKTSYEYQEVSFITGEPILFKGTVTIKKSAKQSAATSTYTYNLKNIDKSATLTRTLVLNTKITKKDNGQTVEETSITVKPTETIRIDTAIYTLRSYDFTRSNLIDPKPAINYYAGNFQGRKIYQTGTGDNIGTVTVDSTGNFYGYDQYWGTTQAEIINYVIKSEKKNAGVADRWGGTARVALSSTTSKQLKYIKNEPTSISFDGGYVQTQYNNSILEYTSSLPEFDSKGNATDNILNNSDSMKLETFPAQTRLIVPNISHLRGHWAENDIKVLYSLEVFKGDDNTFNPHQYMTKAEFTAAMLQAAKEVPPDPALTSKTVSKSTKEVINVPFRDVSSDNIHYTQIDKAYKRGLINGKDDGTFGSTDLLTAADAITIFIRAVGLEALAPATGAVTVFKDNDAIPSYARNAAYVAHRIGLIKGDDRGYLNPNEYITKARASALINRFINYMRDDIRRDYRERIINY